MLDPQILAQLGRRGDTMVAHITPQEAAILRLLGGSGSRNPRTGLLEFFSSDGGDDSGGWGGGWGGDEGGMSVGGFDGGDFGGPGGPSDGADNGSLSDLSSYAGLDLGASPAGVSTSGYSPAELAAVAALGASKGYATNQAITGLYGSSIDEQDQFIGRQMQDKLSMAERLGLSWNAMRDNFTNDPMGYLASKMPSPESIGRGVGTVAGFLSPMLGGAFIGGRLGGWIGSEYAAGNLGPPDSGFSFNDDSGSGDYTQMAQNMVAGPTGVSTAQTVAQPDSFDREAYGNFGRQYINAQGSKADTRSSAAQKGMGIDSGQLAGQLAIQNQQRTKKMQEWNQLMADPNMGYNDLAASLMNILA